MDWETAEGRFRRAIELEPNYASAHHWYAEYLGYEGRFDEAFAEMALPGSWIRV
jgi:Tfp pilus assembly protein PilF